MSVAGTWQFRLSRTTGKLLVRLTALATLYRMPPFVSASALVRNDDRLLVVVDPIRGEPILPGGHLRWRETPEDGLVREVWEETGYLVKPQGLVAVLGGAQGTGEPGIVRLVYSAEVIGGALQSSGEGEAVWRNIDVLAASATRDAAVIRLWRERESGQVAST